MWNVGRAHTVAVGDGGKSLHVPSQQPSENFSLRFAELGKLGCHVRDRAVMLAELRAGWGSRNGGGVAVAAECLGKHRGPLVRVCCLDDAAIALFELGGAASGEGCDGVRTTGLAQEPECAHRHVVVGLGEHVAAAVGEQELLGRATPPAGCGNSGLAHRYDAFGEKGIEVSADSRRGECEPLPQRRGGGRPVLENRRSYPLPSWRIVWQPGARVIDDLDVVGRRQSRGCASSGFHNTIVS